jgi:hypothetical protein
MKRVFYLMTVSLLFFYGCDNEESELQDRSKDVMDVEWQSYHIDGTDQSTTSKSISFEDFQSKPDSQVSFKAPSNHANGHFNTQVGNIITFSAGGGNSLGVFNMSGASNLEGFVRCATVEGNQAVVQVVISNLGDVPDGFPLEVGHTVLYLLEDNGEGANAPDDRYWNFVLNVPFDFESCVELSPSDFLDIFEGCECGAEWIDTAKKSDQIQIK